MFSFFLFGSFFQSLQVAQVSRSMQRSSFSAVAMTSSHAHCISSFCLRGRMGNEARPSLVYAVSEHIRRDQKLTATF